MSRAEELAHGLAREAEAVCRCYLFNGRREGRYWMVGDVKNTPGRSMFVRLSGPCSGKGAAGKWTDAATGHHGDLLDVIRESCGLASFHDVVDEARCFLSRPHDAIKPRSEDAWRPRSALDRARRLFATAQPIGGTLVERYLRHRAITACLDIPALRFHPNCFYRADRHAPLETWPAMVAAVTDLSGELTGIHRTWLDPAGNGKAPIDTPRRAMGHLLGHAVRIGHVEDVAAAGEGIETMLALRSVMTRMPMLAGLSAAHLAAILLPPTLRRLYIARDNDAAGCAAANRLARRAHLAEIETVMLTSRRSDFNDDLRHDGIGRLRVRLARQLVDEDRERYLLKPGSWPETAKDAALPS